MSAKETASGLVAHALVRSNPFFTDAANLILGQEATIARLTNLVRECAQTSCEGYCGPDLGMVTGVDCWGCQIIEKLSQQAAKES